MFVSEHIKNWLDFRQLVKSFTIRVSAKDEPNVMITINIKIVHVIQIFTVYSGLVGLPWSCSKPTPSTQLHSESPP